MSKIKVVTDSTADLTKEEISEYGIQVVPLTIHIDGDVYQDQIDIQPLEFLDKMAASEDLPKSSQPSAGAFTELYNELGEDGSEVISIHMTGGMSGTVKSAEAAAAMTDTSVTVIDSRFISHALSFQVIEAAKLAQQGKKMAEIVQHLNDIRAKTMLYVVVDKLDNLVKGGRIGKGKAMIGSLLNIKPIASLQDGVYTPVGKARSHKQVAAQLFEAFKEDTAGKIVKGVGISHAHGLAMAEPLKRLIEESGFADIRFSFTSPIVSTHTGAGAIGFMYYTE
ncbi:DegV family protein [Sporosarcina gallistercoris]|uniref:DegV family protein n=1 Tax=Sporosarcina gallistercoris TaxID=2762245 RepID=A0ABR8PJG1_9BACL|nr:DegV family protein [Sporosarcina gallistercoris]MBD7908330.1 DegV family protein [Sporosarcina gallistercoris]